MGRTRIEEKRFRRLGKVMGALWFRKGAWETSDGNWK